MVAMIPGSIPRERHQMMRSAFREGRIGRVFAGEIAMVAIALLVPVRAASEEMRGSTGAGLGCPVIALLPPSLPPGSVAAPYSTTVFASGGTSPYTFAATAGTLPPGITLGTGILSGTPTIPGTFAFTLTAVDQTGCAGTRSYDLLIVLGGCLLDISPPTLPNGAVGAPYSVTLMGSGGTAPYTFAVTSGMLPPGLSLATSGRLSGAPTAPGTFTFEVTVLDTAGYCGTRTYDLTIATCGAITLSPAALPDASVGVSYAQTISASGGTAPYAFSVAAGTLPPGLVLAPGGTLSGTPSGTGSFSFTIRAQDSQGCAGSLAYAMEVRRPANYLIGEALVPPSTNRYRVFDASGAPSVDVQAYAAGRFGTNVASGDVNGGTSSEIITGPGPGDVFGPHVRGWDRNGVAMGKISFYAYGTLKYGANVGAGSTDLDAFCEIVAGAGPGAVFGPHVRGFDFDATSISSVAGINFFAYSTLKYGVEVGAASIDADGPAEILTGPGPSPLFAPQVRGWNVDGGAATAIGKVNFNAFPAPQYGVNVAGGDVDKDLFAEIVTAPGPGPSLPAHVLGFDYDGTAVAVLPGFDVTPFTTSGGARTGAGDLDANGSDELLASEGPPGATTEVRTFVYSGGALTQVPFVLVAYPGNCCGAIPATGDFGY
ncbi:MAG: Ig domain-containing protein [Acidobacteriota bacterium]